MDASLSLRRPNNWQDFETLCKKLWGEIWDCPEIKKNGRAGQIQHGIDVYGIPFGLDKYYGIQCKGKDEYTNKQFNEDEIKAEIEKAKLFQPSLKKLYFATTAVKDTGIEEFVRKQNIQNIANGLFEVHIFSWEDIVDLIDENKRTHDFYVRSQNFKTSKSVAVTFNDNLTEITLTPKYKKTITQYRPKIVPADPYNNPLANLLEQKEKIMRPFSKFVVATPMSGTKVNHSYCKIGLKIHNIRLDPIEDYKLFFNFDGEVLDLKESNEEDFGLVIPSLHRYISNVQLWTESMSGTVVPKKAILVGDDTFVSDDIFIKLKSSEYEIIVNWKLISKDYKDEGQLKIIVKPDFEREYKEILVEDPLKVGTNESGFEELIIDKN